MADDAAFQKAWLKVVAKAWADEEYKARLLKEPAAVLRAEGLALPAGRAVRVVESAPGETLLVLPQPSASVGPDAEEERISPIC